MSISAQDRKKITDDLFRAVETSKGAGAYEIEARFGNYNERGHFFPGVAPKQFFAAINTIENQLKWRKTRNRRITTDETYVVPTPAPKRGEPRPPPAQRYRKTIWKHPADTLNEKWIIKQQRADNINLPELGIRLSLQTETAMDAAPPQNLRLENVRNKTRTSFIDPTETVYVDFTVVVANNRSSYEVEVELVKPDPARMGQFFDLVDEITRVVQQSEKVITRTGRQGVIERFNALFKVRKNNLHNNFYAKPVDLKWDNFDEMFDKFKYNVTEKSEGTRSFLFFTDEGVYILQPPFTINFIGPHTDKTRQFHNSLFDCELVKISDGAMSEILIFDTLFFKGSDVRTLTFYPRISKARQLTEPADAGSPKNFISLTTYPYNTTTNISVKGFIFFTNADEMFKAIKEIPQQPWDTDGFIFTPTNEKYQTAKIFKYKPEHLLTIDFIIRNGLPYSFSGEMGADGKPEYVAFEGTADYPYRAYPIYSNNRLLTSNVIWECRYNHETFSFEPIRQRPDRTTANGIEVAKSVWENIINPIGEAIYGGTLKFYFRYMYLLRIKMMQKYAGKAILDVNTSEDNTFLIAQNLNIDLYSFDPLECIVQSPVTPQKKLVFPGESIPEGLKFDAISCFFNLNLYQSPELILQLATRVLKPGGKIFGIFLDLSETTQAELDQLEKVKIVSRLVEGAPAVTVYIQPRVMGNIDAIPMTRTILMPEDLEAMARHYGFSAKFHGSTKSKPEYSAQDNLMVGLQKMFVFERVAGLKGPMPKPSNTVPPFFVNPVPASPPRPVSPRASPRYEPISPRYEPSSPPYFPASPPYFPPQAPASPHVIGKPKRIPRLPDSSPKRTSPKRTSPKRTSPKRKPTRASPEPGEIVDSDSERSESPDPWDY